MTTEMWLGSRRLLCVAVALWAGGALRAEDIRFSADLPDMSLEAAAAEEIPPGWLLGEVDPALALGEIGDFEERTMGFKAGIGFSSFPTTFLMAFQADFFLHPNFAIGPMMQFGISDDDFFFAPTFNVQAMFDLPMEGFEALKPVFNFGLGLVYLDKQRFAYEDDDVGFLINFGVGLEYFVTPTIALGTNFLFNIVPTDVLDENFIFGWQILTVRFQF